MKWMYSLALTLLHLAVLAQMRCVEYPQVLANRMLTDVSYLASDELEGRKPGTAGAEMAANYIQQAFERAKLSTYSGMSGFRQYFKMPVNAEVNWAKTHLQMGGTTYRSKVDFFPSRYSGNASASGKTVYVQYGIEADDLDRHDYKKAKLKKAPIVVMDVGSPDGVHPHSAYIAYHDLGERIQLAIDRGAQAVLLVNVEGQGNDPSPYYEQIRATSIPVVFIQNPKLAQSLKDESQEISLTVEHSEKSVDAFNVVGYLDNSAPTTIVIGAHYDHLGYGGPNSLYALKEEPTIHNGADDNASGTAGLLEIARFLGSRPAGFTQHNYLFLAFSAEEEGLLGSAHFVQEVSDLEDVSFMFNMDMIGRMEDNTLAINGVGTSPKWMEWIGADSCQLSIRTSQSGTGPSDHTSFYKMDIPVLHFFTGTHEDYHKPSDDAEKINAEGMKLVVSYMLNLIQASADIERLEFSATKADETAVPRFSVTLGVMPDYLYDGEGMKIDGVSPEKPAAAAGLEKGDVVIQMGAVKVVDMMSYMKALGQFKKGDTTELRYVRAGEERSTQVTF